jgi:hypothetical protein
MSGLVRKYEVEEDARDHEWADCPEDRAEQDTRFEREEAHAIR